MESEKANEDNFPKYNKKKDYALWTNTKDQKA